MSALGWAAFLVAAGSGAVARYLLSLFVQERTGPDRPWGTFVVNALGCVLAGVVAGAVVHHGLGNLPARVLAVGFLGSFTTFSTLAYESIRLAGEAGVRLASINIVGSLVVGVGGATMGLALVASLT